MTKPFDCNANLMTKIHLPRRARKSNNNFAFKSWRLAR